MSAVHQFIYDYTGDLEGSYQNDKKALVTIVCVYICVYIHKYLYDLEFVMYIYDTYINILTYMYQYTNINILISIYLYR
jgi:hypothetical protein